ncbi:MAG TPA: glycosyltransferase family protein [Candidatus Sulfotelmatobacter sp.]|nr:glycosyltransferase family protein [Candidatus Sulfotelmatobacter sp.]
MRVVAIVQARMGSTRLPGKVLKDIEGVTMLGRVVQRLSRASLIDGLVIATTDLPADDAIVQECQGSSIKVFRGAELDVLDRYFRAAQVAKAEVVVRITSDCPLIDPEVTDKTIAAFLNEMPAYASNCVVRTFPRGLDTEVMTVLALERAWRGADQTYQRIHVTPFIYEHPSEFRILSVTGDADFSHHRWTVDTPEDLEFVRTIYSRLKSREDFRWLDVLEVLDREPGLMELNRSVAQKAVHEG